MDFNSLLRQTVLANIDRELTRIDSLRAPRPVPGPGWVPRDVRRVGQAIGIRWVALRAGLGTLSGLAPRLVRWGWTVVEYRAAVLGLPEWVLTSETALLDFDALGTGRRNGRGPLAVRAPLRTRIAQLITEILEESPEAPVEVVAGWLTALASATDRQTAWSVYENYLPELRAWQVVAGAGLPARVVALALAAGWGPVETHARWRDGTLDEAAMRMLAGLRGFRLPDFEAAANERDRTVRP